MFRVSIGVMLAVTLLLAGCATSTAPASSAGVASGQGANKPAGSSDRALPDMTSHNAVEATERAFAKTMADRDFKAFKSFLSDEAIFMSGPEPLRGKERVAAAWQRYFESPDAPFSWEPEQVVVLESDGLAFSSGPVRAPDGAQVGVFNSVWRRDAGGLWRIVFDKGSCACN